MRKFLTTIILLATFAITIIYYEDIIKYVMYHFVYSANFKYEEENIYARNENWLFVQKTDDFEPKKRQDILNIIYTALDNGWEDFTFFCPKEYETCMSDVEEITNNTTLVSNINNFVGTYNSYNKIVVNMNNFGRVNIVVDHLYSEDIISKISTEVDKIYNSLIKDSMTTEEKIKVIHDYIIDHTIYDDERSEEIKSGNITNLKHSSNIAYGPLFTGKAICGGYTDTMALFLDKMGLKNYKISSKNHIWNFVLIDNEWKHLDLTWDDPVVSTGENVIIDTFFLISTEDLISKETTQHEFNKDIFIEAK